MASSVGSAGRRTAGFAAVVPAGRAGDFFVVAGFFFFGAAAVARGFFFGSGALVLPLAEGAEASSADLLSTEFFDFLATGF